jgi:hypothetical protein
MPLSAVSQRHMRGWGCWGIGNGRELRGDFRSRASRGPAELPQPGSASAAVLRVGPKRQGVFFLAASAAIACRSTLSIWARKFAQLCRISLALVRCGEMIGAPPCTSCRHVSKHSSTKGGDVSWSLNVNLITSPIAWVANVRVRWLIPAFGGIPRTGESHGARVTVAGNPFRPTGKCRHVVVACGATLGRLLDRESRRLATGRSAWRGKGKPVEVAPRRQLSTLARRRANRGNHLWFAIAVEPSGADLCAGLGSDRGDWAASIGALHLNESAPRAILANCKALNG